MSSDDRSDGDLPADPPDDVAVAPDDAAVPPRPAENAHSAGPQDPSFQNGPARSWRRGGRPRTSSSGRWWELPLLVIVAVAVAVVVKTFLVQPFYIPSDSMEQTLHGCPGCAGDKILVNKPIYDLRDPHPGDIVVFRAPDGWEEATVPPARNPLVKGARWFGQLVGVVPPDEKDLVKRVIAIGGQSVRCCDEQGRVQVRDGTGPWRSLNEPYVYLDDHQAFGPVTVPKNRLWVLGDHRGDSADSRYHCGTGTPTRSCDPMSSTVPNDAVIGKAVLIVWPPSRWRTLGTPGTFAQAAARASGSALGSTLSGALSGAPPLAGAALTVLPLAILRRSRRRRRRRRSPRRHLGRPRRRQ